MKKIKIKRVSTYAQWKRRMKLYPKFQSNYANFQEIMRISNDENDNKYNNTNTR